MLGMKIVTKMGMSRNGHSTMLTITLGPDRCFKDGHHHPNGIFHIEKIQLHATMDMVEKMSLQQWSNWLRVVQLEPQCSLDLSIVFDSAVTAEAMTASTSHVIELLESFEYIEYLLKPSWEHQPYVPLLLTVRIECPYNIQKH